MKVVHKNEYYYPSDCLNGATKYTDIVKLDKMKKELYKKMISRKCIPNIFSSNLTVDTYNGYYDIVEYVDSKHKFLTLIDDIRKE